MTSVPTHHIASGLQNEHHEYFNAAQYSQRMWRLSFSPLIRVTNVPSWRRCLLSTPPPFFFAPSRSLTSLSYAALHSLTPTVLCMIQRYFKSHVCRGPTNDSLWKTMIMLPILRSLWADFNVRLHSNVALQSRMLHICCSQLVLHEEMLLACIIQDIISGFHKHDFRQLVK